MTIGSPPKSRTSKGEGRNEPKKVCSVLDGETEIPVPEFNTRQDTADFGISLDDVSKAQIRESFRRSREGVITALSLSLAENADRQIEQFGEVIYLIDSETPKPVYVFNFQPGFAHGSVSGLLTDAIITEAAALAPTLSAEKDMARPASLLLASLERTTGELQRFIATWSAMEIFVNATFKSIYEAKWFAAMETGTPASGKSVLERFKEVMSDKYRLADKFLILASVLDASSANADDREFRRFKKLRDGLLHALDTQSEPLPTEAVQKLLLKYMKLHLVG